VSRPKRPGTSAAARRATARLTAARTTREQVTALSGVISAVAHEQTIPDRFRCASEPPGNCMRITDTRTGRSVVVGLFAYRSVREVLTALFPAPKRRRS